MSDAGDSQPVIRFNLNFRNDVGNMVFERRKSWRGEIVANGLFGIEESATEF